MRQRKRKGSGKIKKITPHGAMSCEVRAELESARYVGNPQHKRWPADYGLNPPADPRPNKSLCDGLRPIKKREAIELFRSGIGLDMVSVDLDHRGLPKRVWAVDEYGEAYEAMSSADGKYHGYRLYRDQDMRDLVIAEWNRRNQLP